MYHSYKGGAGKTLFSLNSASIFARKGLKVLLIESDFRMPTYTDIFSEIFIDTYFNEFLVREDNIENYIYNWERGGFDIIVAKPQFDPKDKINHEDPSNFEWLFSRVDLLENVFSTLSYDVVIFDLTPGNHIFPIISIKLSTDVILITRGQYESILGTIKIVNGMYSKVLETLKSQRKNVVLLINQIPKGEKSIEAINKKINFIKQKTKYNFKKVYTFFYENKVDYQNFISDNQFLSEETNTYKNLFDLLDDTNF